MQWHATAMHETCACANACVPTCIFNKRYKNLIETLSIICSIAFVVDHNSENMSNKLEKSIDMFSTPNRLSIYTFNALTTPVSVSVDSV